jgi:hypothetical protein
LSNWSCDPVSVDRKGGRESTYVPHPFIGVVGGIPPAMLDSLSGEGGRDDGFMDRILFAFPDDEAFPRQRWTEAELSESAVSSWSNAIERLHAVEMLVDPETEVIDPRLIGFTPEAKAEWVAWYDSHEAETEAPDLAEWHGGAWSKMRAHAARFALILARLRQAVDPNAPSDPGPIEVPDVRGAVALVDYFKGHLIKTAHHASGGLSNPDARAILEWIRRKARQSASGLFLLFREADVKDGLRRFRRVPSALTDALADMALAGVVRPHPESPPEGPGRPPSPAWEVNPALFDAPENPENTGKGSPARQFSGLSEYPGDVADGQREVIEL